MQLLTAVPANADLGAMYRRTPREGLVFSGVLHRERFGVADSFNEDLSCAAIAWPAGGEEEYQTAGAMPVTLRSAGAITLARGARYAYAARGDAPFRSNMISFPHWITDGANVNALDQAGRGGASERNLETRLQRPSPLAQRLMDSIAIQCRAGAGQNDWYAENCAQLYEALLDAQDCRAAAQAQLDAVKPSTRAELARRAGLAKSCMLQRYSEAGLSLNQIAREACLSPYHLIRVFAAMTGATPMQFLAAIRMDAAMRLLKETKLSVTCTASRAGYSDRTAFFRAFRKHFGMAPSAVERLTT
jgi:AraC-like DNA-binding protein